MAGTSPAMTTDSGVANLSPRMLLEIFPQDRIDPRLIALALRAKPVEHVGIDPQRHVALALRLRQFGGEPVDLVHRIVGIAAGGQGLLRRGLPVALDFAVLLHGPQFSGRAL